VGGRDPALACAGRVAHPPCCWFTPSSLSSSLAAALRGRAFFVSVGACPLRSSQNLYLGPLVTEEELEAARGGSAGSGEGAKKEPAPAAEAKAKAKEEKDEASKDGGEEGRGSAGGGASSVDRAAAGGLEQLSATGRRALDREESESAGGV